MNRADSVSDSLAEEARMEHFQVAELSDSQKATA